VCLLPHRLLSLRLGRVGLRSLDEIARRRGISRSEAARQAIAETAERERRRNGLAAEAAALAKDPAYVREARQVVALMEELRGRGDVHEVELPRVQHRRRFAVIVQADDLLALSTVVVCPTSTSTPPASFHPEVTIGDERTRIMCEMVGAIDVRALGSQIAHPTFDEMRSVDDALELVLDLR